MSPRILLAILGIATANAFAADAFEDYCNSRFNFCMDMPAGLKAQPAPENGDGRTWKGKGGSEVRAWGQWNAAEETMKEACESDAKELDSIVLNTVRKDWCAVSGFKKGKIEYRRRELASGRWVVFDLVYPASERDFFDGKIGKMAKSLKILPMEDDPK